MEEVVDRPGLLRSGQICCRLFKPGIVPRGVFSTGLSSAPFTSIGAIFNFGPSPEDLINTSHFLNGCVSVSVGSMSLHHGASSGWGRRRQSPDMEGSCNNG
jgi:hypothetical protein